MTAAYDNIAEEFKQSRMLPFRTVVESHTYLGLIGDCRGRSVLDLACGDGVYSRELRRLGAARVVGVDISEQMVALACAEEDRAPLGIEYVHEDVRTLGRLGSFDLVVASFLLNYAQTRDDLERMCRAIAANLRPGGRFVSINNNPSQAVDSYRLTRKYGLEKSLDGERLTEGAPIRITLHVAEGQEVSFDNYYLEPGTYEAALHAAGLERIRWADPVAAPRAATEEPGFWDDFVRVRPIVGLEATRA